MKHLLPLPLILLAACSDPGESGEPAPRPAGETIACAIGEPVAFDEECIVERTGEDIVVHHPDGSFRRLTLDPAGAGLIAADGADDSRQRIMGNWLILEVGPDAYRFPFTDASIIDG